MLLWDHSLRSPLYSTIDLEADAGAISEQEGEAMCAAVNRKWNWRVASRWPAVFEKCKQSLGHMILNNSRVTDKGLKISYPIIYPWLIFPCNTMALRDEVGSMSEMPQFHYSMANGERRSFIDPVVYTSNRQFRLLLCNKLSDALQTVLRLQQHLSITLFLRSCITHWHIGNNVGLVPHNNIQRVLRGKPSRKKRGEPCRNSTGLSALAASDPLGRFLHQLPQEQGQPKGTLTPTSGSLREIKFRWSEPPGQLRPCNTARIWLPSQAEHKSTGAWVSVTHQGEVNLICPHPQCLHRGCSYRRRICPSFTPQTIIRYGRGSWSCHL